MNPAACPTFSVLASFRSTSKFAIQGRMKAKHRGWRQSIRNKRRSKFVLYMPRSMVPGLHGLAERGSEGTTARLGVKTPCEKSASAEVPARRPYGLLQIQRARASCTGDSLQRENRRLKMLEGRILTPSVRTGTLYCKKLGRENYLCGYALVGQT